MLVNCTHKQALSNILLNTWLEKMVFRNDDDEDESSFQIVYNSKFSSLPLSVRLNKKPYDDHSPNKMEKIVGRVIEIRNQLLDILSKNLKTAISKTSNDDKIIFPFDDLPSICKVLVFSKLGELDKGRSSMVCKEWNQLIKSPQIWRTVDLSFLKNCDFSNGIISFSKFLDCNNCRISSLTIDFKYAIDNIQEMKFFLATDECQSLKSITFNQHLDNSDSQDVLYKNRRNQRKSIDFLETLVAAIPNLEKLAIPFDWSINSINALSKLKHLKKLTLKPSSKFQNLEQNSFDILLKSLTSLEYLDIEASAMSGLGFQYFTFQSASLKYLHLSKSKGLHVQSLKTPNLLELNLSHDPCYGPLMMECDFLSPPSNCLHSIISQGAPKLQRLNDLSISTNWLSPNEDLNSYLALYCSCINHRNGK